MRDNTDVVAAVKAQLESAGVPLNTPCGAHRITMGVVWALRNEGAGFLSKTTGNNCEGRAVDVVFFRDGTWVDCLVNSETENRPAWQVGPDKLETSRWVAPVNPDGGGQPEPAPIPAPPPAVDEIERLITIGEHIVDAIEELVGTINGLDQKLTELQQRGVRLRL